MVKRLTLKNIYIKNIVMIEKWYRGHEGSKNATDNFGIIWLADDPEYAQLYADEYPNGVVSTVFVDMDKINYLDWYYDEDFDPYDPDMSLLKNYMKEQGCNAYTFPLNDGITVLALLTTEPIVKIEKTIIENKKYRNMKIKLTESKLKQIVAESVKNVLNENQYGIVTENPEINQLWNELMTLKNGLIRDIIRKYGWGKTSDQIGGKVVVKQIMAINNAISTFNAILQGTTADNEEHWSRIEHEQD